MLISCNKLKSHIKNSEDIDKRKTVISSLLVTTSTIIVSLAIEHISAETSLLDERLVTIFIIASIISCIIPPILFGNSDDFSEGRLRHKDYIIELSVDYYAPKVCYLVALLVYLHIRRLRYVSVYADALSSYGALCVGTRAGARDAQEFVKSHHFLSSPCFVQSLLSWRSFVETQSARRLCRRTSARSLRNR